MSQQTSFFISKSDLCLGFPNENLGYGGACINLGARASASTLRTRHPVSSLKLTTRKHTFCGGTHMVPNRIYYDLSYTYKQSASKMMEEVLGSVVLNTEMAVTAAVAHVLWCVAAVDNEAVAVHL